MDGIRDDQPIDITIATAVITDSQTTRSSTTQTLPTDRSPVSHILSALTQEVTDVALNRTPTPEVETHQPDILCKLGCNGATTDSTSTDSYDPFDPYNVALYTTLTICMSTIVLIILFMTAAILYTRYKSWKRKREIGVKGLSEQLGASVSPAFALIARRTNVVPGTTTSTSRPVSQNPPPALKQGARSFKDMTSQPPRNMREYPPMEMR